MALTDDTGVEWSIQEQDCIMDKITSAEAPPSSGNHASKMQAMFWFVQKPDEFRSLMTQSRSLRTQSRTILSSCFPSVIFSLTLSSFSPFAPHQCVPLFIALPLRLGLGMWVWIQASLIPVLHAWLQPQRSFVRPLGDSRCILEGGLGLPAGLCWEVHLSMHVFLFQVNGLFTLSSLSSFSLVVV